MKKLFIIGCDRSGTTVLARNIALRTRAIFLPEMQFLGEIINVSRAQINDSNMQHLFKPFSPYCVDMLSNLKNIHTLEAAFKHVYEKIGINLNENLDLYLDHTPWADKYLDEELISNDVFFIHVIRNGNDVVQSIMSQKWGANTIYYGQKYWSNRVLEIKKFLSDKNSIEIFYDDYLNNAENVIKTIINFLDVSEIAYCQSNDKMKLSNRYAKQHMSINSKKIVKKHHKFVDYSYHANYINLMKNLFGVEIKFRKLPRIKLFFIKIYEAIAGAFK